MHAFGERIGRLLSGGEVLELVGDVGAGKTTLTKGIALGMDIDDDVQSPTFTISRIYDSPRGLRLSHYDFYRLSDAGIMAAELHEAVNDPGNVTIIEWAEIVSGVLPEDQLTIRIAATPEDSRIITMTGAGDKAKALLKELA